MGFSGCVLWEVKKKKNLLTHYLAHYLITREMLAFFITLFQFQIFTNIF